MSGDAGFVIEGGVLKKYAGPGGEVAVPAGVTAIGHHAFACRDDLTGIAFGPGVREIGDAAFVYCKALKAVTIPGSVARVGRRAFEGCAGLERIVIPAGVREIGEEAFHDCVALKRVDIAEGVIRIGARAFAGCSALGEIVIPASVTRLGDGALAGCRGLSRVAVSAGSRAYRCVDNVILSADGKALAACPWREGPFAIPPGVEMIGRDAFRGCRALTGVAIPPGVVEIGEGAFAFCTALEDVTIPGSVARVGDAAFWCCDALARVSVEAGVREIGDGAFFGCKRLLRADLPGSLTRLGARAFYDCWSLARIAVPGGVTRLGERTFEDCFALAAAALPEALAAIDDRAFRGCRSLRRVSLPGGVKRLGAGAFAYCTQLSDVDLPAGLQAIGDDAFLGCATLRGLSLPEGLISIGRGAFNNCAGLTGAMITDSVTDFGVFSGCRKLEAFAVSPASRRYSVEDGVVLSKDGRRLIAYPPGRRAARYDVPATVAEVGDHAFAGAPVRLVFVHGGVTRFTDSAARGEADGDPFVASGNPAFIPVIGKPIYLGRPEDLPNRHRRRAVAGFLYALEVGMPEIMPWRESYIDLIRRERDVWEKKAWRNDTLLRLMAKRRMLRAETAGHMLRRFAAEGREDLTSLLSDYLAPLGR